MEDRQLTYADLIGQRIVDLMLEREWNIATVARLADLPHSTVNAIILKGRISPTMVTVHSIAIAFKMSVSEFLDFPEMNNLTKEEIKKMKNDKKM